MRTVDAFRKTGEVYYQYAGTKKNEIDNVSCLPIKKPESNKKNVFYSQRRAFDNEILKFVEELDYNLAYFHYFPSTLPLKIFRTIKKRGKSFIFDLHEIIPEQFLPEKFSYLNPIMWKIFKKQIQISDGLVTISTEAMEFMSKKTEISKPYIIVENYAKKSTIRRNKKNKEIIVVGKSSRNNSSIFKILTQLKNKGFRIKSIGINLDIADINLPVLPYDEMMEEISKSAFSIIAYQNRKDPTYPNEVFSLPNKFFDSLAARTPIILSNRFESMRKIIDETGTGITIDLNNSAEKSVEKILTAWNSYENFQTSLEKNQDRFVWSEDKENNFIDFAKMIQRVGESSKNDN